MKHLTFLVSLVVMVGVPTAHAQYVKGNEAVRVLPDGTKKVETPPLPTTSSTKSKPCSADGACHNGPWHMVETQNGLVECTEVYARPTTCRTSTYGGEKRSRLWVVKSAGIWKQCQFPDIKSKCVPIFAPPPANLPHEAVQ